VLGAAAAIMSIREIGAREKFCWLLVVFALLWGELRSIKKDDVDRSDARAAEAANFKKIADGLATEIEQSQKQFEATMTRANSIATRVEHAADLAKRDLENVTGGNAFATLTPQIYALSGEQTPIPLVLYNHGGNVLTGVTITIEDTPNSIEEFEPNKEYEKHFTQPRFEVGTLSPYDVRTIPIMLPPPLPHKDGTHICNIQISAQNGAAREMLIFRKNKYPASSPGSPWGYRMVVSRTTVASKATDKTTFKTKELVNTKWSDDLNEELRIKRSSR
jgi:hypothetical protein